jgi:hypothetical protein
VQRLVERLAVERGLQFSNRLIERRYLCLQPCDLIVIPLRVFRFLLLPVPLKWDPNSAERRPIYRSVGFVIRRGCRSSKLFSAAFAAAIVPVRAFELAQK